MVYIKYLDVRDDGVYKRNYGKFDSLEYFVKMCVFLEIRTLILEMVELPEWTNNCQDYTNFDYEEYWS